jgi:two-component system, OmpR family, response regulator RegX3
MLPNGVRKQLEYRKLSPNDTRGMFIAYRSRRYPGHLTVLSTMRVALLENDPLLATSLNDWLVHAGHRCIRHERGQRLVQALTQETFDALVLGGSPPGLGSAEVLKRVRGDLQSSLPILVIGVGETEDDVVTPLQDGADDCMRRPVRRLELLARLEAIARRGILKPGRAQVIELGPLRIDCRTRTVRFDERPIELTAKDFDLSVLFLRNVGQLLSRNWLCETVWGPKAVIGSRTLDTHVYRIRHRLRLTPGHGWRLAAVYGHGYRLQHTEISAGTARLNGASCRHHIPQPLQLA